MANVKATNAKTATKATNAKAKAAAPVAPAPVVVAPTAPLAGRALAAANVAAKAQAGVGVTQHTSGAAIKGLAAQPITAKPQQKMCQYVSAIKGHPGKGNCVHRFHLYAVGQTLLHAKATAGMTPNDLTFYAQCGYLTLSPCTDAQYQAIVASWQAAQGNPEATPDYTVSLGSEAQSTQAA